MGITYIDGVGRELLFNPFNRTLQPMRMMPA